MAKWAEPPHTPANTNDVVNKPDHYASGKIECVDYLYDNLPIDAFIGGLEWNIKKYMHRWRYKTKPVEDLKKAQWYLNKLIETLDGNDD